MQSPIGGIVLVYSKIIVLIFRMSKQHFDTTWSPSMGSCDSRISSKTVLYDGVSSMGESSKPFVRCENALIKAFQHE